MSDELKQFNLDDPTQGLPFEFINNRWILTDDLYTKNFIKDKEGAKIDAEKGTIEVANAGVALQTTSGMQLDETASDLTIVQVNHRGKLEEVDIEIETKENINNQNTDDLSSQQIVPFNNSVFGVVYTGATGGSAGVLVGQMSDIENVSWLDDLDTNTAAVEKIVAVQNAKNEIMFACEDFENPPYVIKAGWCRFNENTRAIIKVDDTGLNGANINHLYALQDVAKADDQEIAIATSRTEYDFTLDQEQDVSNQSSTQANGNWQSFQPTENLLSRVGLFLSVAGTSDLTTRVKIYEGEGVAGTLLATSDDLLLDHTQYGTPQYAYYDFNNSQYPLRVTPSSTYTIEVEEDSNTSNFRWAYQDTNVYANGRKFNSATQDFRFRTYYSTVNPKVCLTSVRDVGSDIIAGTTLDNEVIADTTGHARVISLGNNKVIVIALDWDTFQMKARICHVDGGTITKYTQETHTGSVLGTADGYFEAVQLDENTIFGVIFSGSNTLLFDIDIAGTTIRSINLLNTKSGSDALTSGNFANHAIYKVGQYEVALGTNFLLSYDPHTLTNNKVFAQKNSWVLNELNTRKNLTVMNNHLVSATEDASSGDTSITALRTFAQASGIIEKGDESGKSSVFYSGGVLNNGALNMLPGHNQYPYINNKLSIIGKYPIGKSLSETKLLIK